MDAPPEDSHHDWPDETEFGPHPDAAIVAAPVSMMQGHGSPAGPPLEDGSMEA